MTGLAIRSPLECRFDLVALGEVMLRLDPGAGRIRTARRFDVWEGGGEYNVARGLRRCFGLRTGIVTALADNEVGHLVEDLMLQGGVDTSLVQWLAYDGMGRSVRNGLNFTERGYGIRGAVGVSDRGHTAIGQLHPDAVDWDHLFGSSGARWFHSGGIFAGLSDTTPQLLLKSVQAAKRHGTVVSYDLNYRPSIWSGNGGTAWCQRINKEVVPFVDVLIGNEEDFTAALGFDVPDTHASLTQLDPAKFRQMIDAVHRAYPNLRVIATTLRSVHTASVNDWSAVLWADGTFFHAPDRPGLEILDRVGGGDGFASGMIFGLMELGDPQAAVEFGAAHGALAMTTPGDTSMATRAEVEALVRGDSTRVRR